MSRESETASAVEMWEKVRGAHHAMMEAGDEMARLLRESNPSIISNGSTEPAAPAVGEDRLLLEIIGREQRWRERAEHELKVALADLARLKEEREAQPAREVPEAWTATKDAMPEKSRGLLAFCQGFKEHSGVSWRRTGFAFMAWHPPEWSEQHMKDARKRLDADSLEVTHWMYLTEPKETA